MTLIRTVFAATTLAFVVALARGEDETNNAACGKCYLPDGAQKPGTNWAKRTCTSTGDPHVRGFTMNSGEIGGAPQFLGVLWLVTWWEQEGTTCVKHFVKIKTKHWGRDDEGALAPINASHVDDDGTLHIRGELPAERDVEGGELVEGDEATVGDVGMATLPLSQGGGCFSSGCRSYPSGAKVCFHPNGGKHTSVHIELPECLRTAGAAGTCVVNAVSSTGWGCPHHTTRTSSLTPEPTPEPTPDPTPDPTPKPPEDDFCLQDSRHAARDLCRQVFFARFGPSCPGMPDQIIECVEDVCLLDDPGSAVLETLNAAMEDYANELEDEGVNCSPMTTAPATMSPLHTIVPQGAVLMRDGESDEQQQQQ
jgi:hypothetical protein